MHTLFKRLLAASLLAGLLTAPLAQASDKDHERARQAVQAGQVLALPAVLKKLAATHPGQVLEVELEHERDRDRKQYPEQGRWVYEIKLLQRDGQLIKLELDAKTAEVLRSKIRK